MTIFSHFPCAEQQSEAQIRGGQGRRTQGLISPSARWHLKLDGRVELERLEGRVQALYSVRVTAGRGGGGRMLQGERGRRNFRGVASFRAISARIVTVCPS